MSNRSGEHQCPVDGCNVQVPNEKLMCRRHWFKIPGALRAEVWREYRKQPQSPEHLEACKRAIDAVNQNS